jgi:hypothetical protein
MTALQLDRAAGVTGDVSTLTGKRARSFEQYAIDHAVALESSSQPDAQPIVRADDSASAEMTALSPSALAAA